MLRKHFLGDLSDWTGESLMRLPRVMDEAAEDFGLDTLLRTSDEPDLILGLFSEWLVYDYRPKLLGGKTGLERFIRSVQLPPEDLAAYKELLDFECGLFEIGRIEKGRGVVLKSLATGKEHFVHDVNSSLVMQEGDTAWARIAPVGGLYHAVGSAAFTLPITMESGMRELLGTGKKNQLNAREAAHLAARESPSAQDFVALPYEKAEQTFLAALKECGMDTMFTIKTYTKWITDEKRYGDFFHTNALLFLVPDDAPKDALSRLIAASGTFSNSIPRKSLGGRTPNEARQEEGLHHMKADAISAEPYHRQLYEAQKLITKRKYRKAYEVLEGLIRELLEKRLPFFHAFRAYANAATACEANGEHDMAEALVNAALRLNPQYDFGLSLKEQLTPSLRGVPKENRALVQSIGEIIRKEGERKYRKTAFYTYEKFLKEIGVNLSHVTRTTVTTFKA